MDIKEIDKKLDEAYMAVNINDRFTLQLILAARYTIDKLEMPKKHKSELIELLGK